MRALVVGGGRLTFEGARREPAATTGEVRVDVRLAGICATDLEIRRGYMGFEGVPGHEFVGIAREGRLAGRRVVGEINAACGDCERCARGLVRHCARRTVLGILGRDGAFADALALPERNLLPVPDGVPDEAAVFTEPLAAALEILAQVPTAAARRVAVLGDGRLGLLCSLALVAAGSRVVLFGRHPRKLALAARAGAETRDGAKACEGSLRATFPIVVEATGSAEGLGLALDLVEPRGTLVLKTTTRDLARESLARIVIDEVTVVGSRCGAFEPALQALESGSIDPKVLIDERFPLERGVEAFARAAAPGVLKVLLEVNPNR